MNDPFTRLGDFLRFESILPEDQIQECLSIQCRMARAGYSIPLGKILVERFYLDRFTLDELLRFQAQQRNQPGDDFNTRAECINLTLEQNDRLIERARGRIPYGQVNRCFRLQCLLEDEGIEKQLGDSKISIFTFTKFRSDRVL